MAFPFAALGEDLMRVVVEQSMKCRGEYTIPSVYYGHMKFRPTCKTLQSIVNSVVTEFDAGYSVARPASRDQVHVTCEQHQRCLEFDAASLQFEITRDPHAPLRQLFKMECRNRDGVPIMGFTFKDNSNWKIAPDMIDFILLMSHRHIDADSILGGSNNRIN